MPRLERGHSRCVHGLRRRVLLSERLHRLLLRVAFHELSGPRCAYCLQLSLHLTNLAELLVKLLPLFTLQCLLPLLEQRALPPVQVGRQRLKDAIGLAGLRQLGFGGRERADRRLFLCGRCTLRLFAALCPRR